LQSPEKADLNIRHLLASGLSITIGKEVERRKSHARSIFGHGDIEHKIDRNEKLSRKISESLYSDIIPKSQFRKLRSKSHPKIIIPKNEEDDPNLNLIGYNQQSIAQTSYSLTELSG
jgi:hypothetical protein